jgi:YggT family protein
VSSRRFSLVLWAHTNIGASHRIAGEEQIVISLINLIHVLMTLYSLALIGRIFLEMVLGPYHGVVVFLRRITEPVLAPIRRVIPPVQSGGMAWDLAPMVALLLLWVIERFLTRALLAIAASSY